MTVEFRDEAGEKGLRAHELVNHRSVAFEFIAADPNHGSRATALSAAAEWATALGTLAAAYERPDFRNEDEFHLRFPSYLSGPLATPAGFGIVLRALFISPEAIRDHLHRLADSLTTRTPRVWSPRRWIDRTTSEPSVVDVVTAIVAAGRHGELNRRIRHASTTWMTEKITLPPERLIDDDHPAPGVLLPRRTATRERAVFVRYLAGAHDIEAFATDTAHASMVMDLYREVTAQTQ